jgi:hypothetical protein
VADKWNSRTPFNLEELHSNDSSVPCLDDLADADLWAALDRERALWEGRVQVRWTRSHPERRAQRAAWTRHDHGNNWADKQADDSLLALEHTLQEDTARLELVDPSAEGNWGVAWEGSRIITNVNKAIRAAISADSFYNYLEVNRGWPAETLSLFSRERWASKLDFLRAAANATVITKMITGREIHLLKPGHQPKLAMGAHKVN